jgi:hypothetical protein
MVSRLVHSAIGLLVSISSAAWSIFVTHGQQVAVAVSITAGLFTIRAARSAHALHKAQKESLANEVKIRHIRSTHGAPRNRF